MLDGAPAFIATRMVTLEDRLISSGNRPAGFDYLRLCLSLLIISFHSIVTCYGLETQRLAVNSWAGPFVLLLVPVFFSLSGFLVAGSLLRTKTAVSFLGLRAIRILPALAVETVLSAFLLGTLFTELPATEYFSNKAFWEYMLNMVGDIHYYLPGVFKDNPANIVNGQLWTIPAELQCYAALALIFICGLVSRRVWFLTVFTAGLAALWIRTAVHYQGIGLQLPTRALVLCFLVGVLFYLYRDKVIWSKWLALASAVLSVWLLYHPKEIDFACIPITYLTAYLGLTNPKRLWVVRTGDYSYGLYLYGFPLQQALMSLSPSLRHWWINIPAAILISTAFAAFSWHFVEKHALKLRPFLYRLEAGALDFVKTRALQMRGKQPLIEAPETVD